MFFSFNFFCSSSSSWHSTRGKGFRTKRNRLQREIPCSGKCVWVLRKHPCVNCYTDRVYMTYTHTHCSVPAQLQVAKQYGAYFIPPLSFGVYFLRSVMENYVKLNKGFHILNATLRICRILCRTLRIGMLFAQALLP